MTSTIKPCSVSLVRIPQQADEQSKIHSKVQEFSKCPICDQVLEKEIYQCSAGHIICNHCVFKVAGDLCPQCRNPFGSPKIRARALEDILDCKTFVCKFSENGCPKVIGRKELSEHGKICKFNPDTVALCELVGHHNCKYRMGCVTREDIISHFRKNMRLHPVVPALQNVWTISGWMLMLTKSEMGIVTQMSVLFNLNHANEGPVFLAHVKLNRETGNFSLFAIQLCGSTSERYIVEFTFIKNDLPGPATRSKNDPASNPFPMKSTQNIISLKEAGHFLKTDPANISFSKLRRCHFGTNKQDHLRVEIKHAI